MGQKGLSTSPGLLFFCLAQFQISGVFFRVEAYLNLPVSCISKSCIKININLKLYSHFFGVPQKVKALHKTFRGTTKIWENKISS